MTTTRFLPWMRTGLAASLPENQRTGALAQLSTELVVHADGDTFQANGPTIVLRGPGDVVGFNAAEIKRRDPEAGASGVETNYFCSVEFFSPDLPWRYTPSGATDDQLRPWLALVVVELGTDVTLSSSGRLPTLHVEDPVQHLPDLDDAWAWAHVQVATTATKLDVAAAYKSDPGSFSSRLLCPRRLNVDTTYTACLVPTFEAGRLAGLGILGSTDLTPAWDQIPVDLPVYDSWVLTAGDRFDFKTLAARIEPDEVPADVGFRDLDLTDMGSGMTPISRPATYVGAMHAPTTEIVYWAADADRVLFETDLRKRLADAPPTTKPTQGFDPLNNDPVVAPSIYGGAQVGTTTLPPGDVPTKKGRRREKEPNLPNLPKPDASPGWFEELNLGPQHRSVAGLGAEVVRSDQEALMAAAWEQARPTVEVNRTLNRGRLAEEVARQAQFKFDAVDDTTAVAIASPSFVATRVNGTTVHAALANGDTPLAYFGSAFRRLGRPNGPLAMPIDEPAGRAPAWAITHAVVQSAKGAADVPDNPLSISFRIRHLPSGMDVGTDLLASDPVFESEPFPGHLPGQVLTRNERLELQRSIRARRGVPVEAVAVSATQSGAKVRATPLEIDGKLVEFEVGEIVVTEYSFEVVRASTAGRVVTTSVDSAAVGLDIAATVRTEVQPAIAVFNSVKNKVSVPAATWHGATIPTRVGLEPRFADPMYERLRALSVDFLVPGIGSVRNNTLGLLELNPAYIEAFLVGLNHEMSREFRWREYPAALNQTWFQNFFDKVDPEAVDIGPIDSWQERAPLGAEFSAQFGIGPDSEPGLILLLKADLLRKYPDVRVYAVPATVIDDERVPDPVGEAVGPAMVGTLQRGVNFYGFPELTEEEARGDGLGHGWFFVLEEEPRSMRFGLDRGTPADKGALPKYDMWANLAWPNLATKGGDVPMFCSINPPNSEFDTEEDLGTELTWGDDAAVMAAITFRQPIQVLTHASAMLPDPGGS